MTKFKPAVSALFLCATALFWAAPMSGGTIAVGIGTVTSGVDNSTYNTGFAFTTSIGFTVTGFDVYDAGGDGLLNSHDVGIFDSVGTLLVSATIPAGTVATLNGVYRSVTISPFALAAGSYVLSELSVTSFDPGVVNVTSVTPIAGLTVGATDLVLKPSPAALTKPTTLSGFGQQFFTGNFEVSDVPEPATLSLAGIALIGGLLLRRFRRAT